MYYPNLRLSGCSKSSQFRVRGALRVESRTGRCRSVCDNQESSDNALFWGEWNIGHSPSCQCQTGRNLHAEIYQLTLTADFLIIATETHNGISQFC
jgi:hypothetical protein